MKPFILARCITAILQVEPYGERQASNWQRDQRDKEEVQRAKPHVYAALSNSGQQLSAT